MHALKKRRRYFISSLKNVTSETAFTICLNYNCYLFRISFWAEYVQSKSANRQSCLGQKVFSMINEVRYNTIFERKSREILSQRYHSINKSFCMLNFRLIGKVLYYKCNLRFFICVCFLFISLLLTGLRRFLFYFKEHYCLCRKTLYCWYFVIIIKPCLTIFFFKNMKYKKYLKQVSLIRFIYL